MVGEELAVVATATPSIFRFNSGTLYLFLVVLLIIYIYLWLHNMDAAKKVTYVLFAVFIFVGKFLLQALIAIGRMLGNLSNRFFR